MNDTAAVAPARAPLARREFLSLSPGWNPADTEFWIRIHRPAMACRFEITLPSHAACDIPAAREALDEVDAIEALLSVYRESSALTAINRTAAERAVPAGPELLDLLSRSRTLHTDTGGAFDATTTPLSRAWGFFRREGRLPDSAKIDAAMLRVGMHKVALDEEAGAVRFLQEGVELNFNAIGKGYALDRIASGLRRRGVKHALLSAGGSSVLAIGGGRRGFVVDIRSRSAAAPLARLRIRDAALGTSGAGEQSFEVDGRRFGHVLDPRTGWPARGALSVSVVADDAATADALATAFFVGGAELAHRYCTEHPRTLALVTPDTAPHEPQLFGHHDGVRFESEGHPPEPRPNANEAEA
jgi:thiamine biosynthesis lipoprotein